MARNYANKTGFIRTLSQRQCGVVLIYSHVNDKNKSQDAIFKNQLFSEALELILIGQIIGKKCT